MISFVKTIILKFIFFILTFTLLVSTFLSVKVYSDEGTLYTEGDFQYYIVDDSIRIARYIGDDSEVYVPYSFGLYEVKGIERGAFVGTGVQTVHYYNNIVMDDKNLDPAFDPGTTLIKESVDGAESVERKSEDTEDTNLASDNNQDSQDNELGNEEQNLNDSIFEDVTDDIIFESEDDDENEEPGFFEQLFGFNDDNTNNEKDRKKVRNRLFEIFDANNYSSDFNAQPVGYFIILFSIVSIIYLVYRYFHKK